ncbi:Fc.00g039600.m01.CDS01 [Cosmosporella sp. VM-42]
MRLLNVRSMRLEIHETRRDFYAILSHTWGHDEVLYTDIEDPKRQKELRRKNTPGWQKIVGTCDLASKLGITHVWIDTCCIDKSSSAELSEAINSMFQWYRTAKTCFAYLSDVKAGQNRTIQGFETSRWFTRGWTLQELLAPLDVEFYDRNWQSLGLRSELAWRISQITGIGEQHLSPGHPRHLSLRIESIATRMSWAATRQTTRVEDIAYCLMGIFDVNMPLLYGEGPAAFTRLQEEIIKISHDQSILAWRGPRGNLSTAYKNLPFFARSPSYFDTRIYEGQEDPIRFSMMLTPKGLELGVLISRCVYSFRAASDDLEHRYLAVLDCSLTPDTLTRPAILLESALEGSGEFWRIRHRAIVSLEPGGKVQVLDSSEGFTKIGFIELDPEGFKEETILLQSTERRQSIRGRFPFKLNIVAGGAQATDVKQKASYAQVAGIIHGRLASYFPINSIAGLEILSIAEDEVFLVYWGLVSEAVFEPASQEYGDKPRLWQDNIPVCVVQSWSDLTGNSTFDEDTAEMHWERVAQTVPAEAHGDYYPQEPQGFQRLFRYSARPSVEYKRSGVHVRAAMERVEFLGRELCQLNVEIL